MKLSVITICYNIKNEIERTCQSIVSQTNQDFEWIVIDGNSTDGTRDILNKYKDKMTVYISEPDTGIYNAMNKALRQAKGEFVNFMNGGDCFADENAVQKFYDSQIKDADIIYGNTNFIKPNHQKKTGIFPDKIDKIYFGYSCINHQSTFIRRALFDKYGLYDESYKIAADWEKWIVFAKNKCTFTHLNETIADFYCNGVSHRQKKKLKQELDKVLAMHFSEEERRIISEIRSRTNIYLFNFILVYKICKKNKISRHYLLGFIPFLKIKTK